MIIYREQIELMTLRDFQNIEFRYLKIFTSKPLEIAGKTSKEFTGYIIGLTFPPLSNTLPNHIIFVEQGLTKGIQKKVLPEYITEVFIPYLEQIELEDNKQL